jgi:hypothetical protein
LYSCYNGSVPSEAQENQDQGETDVNYIFKFEATDTTNDNELTKSNCTVTANDEPRAREFAEAWLEENFSGEEGWQLLSLELVRTEEER